MSDFGCDFRLKTINQDFHVTEVPLLPDFDSTPKTYTYLWLEKSNYTTFEALEKLQAFFSLNFEDTVAEGLKDEDGVTEQLISVKKKLTIADLKNFNRDHSGLETFIKISLKGFGANPLRAKSLHGNSFRVVVRNLSETEAEKISTYVKNHRFFSFINYYDNQRFGLPGGPYTTHLIGKAICEEKWDEAFSLLKNSGNEIPAGKTGKVAFLALNSSRVGFYISSYSSFLWNNAVSAHLASKFTAKNFNFPGIGQLSLPPSSVTNLPTGIFYADGFSFDKETFSVSPRKNGRNITLPSTVYVDSKMPDELFPGKTRLTLSFFLSTGGYATMMVKQIIKKALEEE